MAHRSVALLLASPADEALWRSLLASQQVSSTAIQPLKATIREALAGDARLHGVGALVIDLPLLVNDRLSLPAFTRWAKERWPEVRIIARVPARARISVSEEAWAVTHGAAALLPGQSSRAVRETVLPALRKVAHALQVPEIDVQAAENFLRVLSAQTEAPHSAAIGRTYVGLERLIRAGIRPDALCASMMSHGGVATRDRVWRGRTYRQCFVGAEAIGWLRERHRLADSECTAAAEIMGMLGMIHHVAREHPLAERGFYYRFSGLPAILDALDLNEVARALRDAAGVRIADRIYLGKTYAHCFVGSEAVDWLCLRHRLLVGEAEAIGQRLMDLGIVRHVVDDHGFVDSPYFYRFTADEAV